MIKRILEILRRFLFNREIRFGYFAKLGFYNRLSDELFLKKKYRLVMGKELDLIHPKELDEKFQWYKVNYRTPLMTQCADKVAVREYVKACGLEELLNRQYGVYDCFEDINFSALPQTFYMKCNHNSGMNALVRQDALTDQKKKELCCFFERALKRDYYQESREWAYKHIPPKIICEELLESRNGKPLVDLNFFCFGGRVKMLYYNVGLADAEGKHSVGKRAVFDEQLCFVEEGKTHMGVLPKEEAVLPECIHLLYEYAEQLAKPFPHARIDFFYINDRPYFGEITFYSASGYMYLEPKSLYDNIGEAFPVEDC